jgi:hypothetical protein
MRVTRNGWLFSPIGDAAVFGLPLLCSYILAYAMEGDSSALYPLLPWMLASCIIISDTGHVFSSAFRTVLDGSERKRKAALFFLVPLLSLLFLYMILAIGARHFRVFVTYMVVVHFIRQQYGWMVISARKGGADGRGLFMDKLAIYNATVPAIVFWHAKPSLGGWFFPDGFIALPLAFQAPTICVHATCVVVYVVWEIRCYLNGAEVNLSKWMILGTTWAGWTGSMMIIQSSVLIRFVLLLTHGIPYLAFIYRYGKARWSGKKGLLAALFAPGRVYAFMGFNIALAFSALALWDFLGGGGEYVPATWFRAFVNFLAEYVLGDGGHGAAGLERILKNSTIPFVWVVPITHYILDAIVWKSGSLNPGLKEYLGMSVNARSVN